MKSMIVIAALAALAGCDARATATGPTGAPVRADQLSKEYESCAATMQCAEGLRCFGDVCTRPQVSVVGDYHAAVAARSAARAEHDKAIEAYGRAQAAYDQAAIEAPAEMECGYGTSLAALRANRDKAELAARVLHRCLLAAPPGSPLYHNALARLAELDESGLDPTHLARGEPADLYLTRAPARPSTEKLKVTVSADPTPKAKAFEPIAGALTGPDLRGPLIGCWEAATASSKAAVLQASFELKVIYKPSEYDDEPGRYAATIDAYPGPAPDQAIVERCIKAAVDPALTQLKGLTTAFSARLQITVQ